MDRAEALRRYNAAAHAMQSGVAMKMNYDQAETQPKHLRTGINSAMVEHAGLVRLLVEKGVITEQEHLEAIAAEMEREARRYKDFLQKITGRPVILR